METETKSTAPCGAPQAPRRVAQFHDSREGTGGPRVDSLAQRTRARRLRSATDHRPRRPTTAGSPPLTSTDAGLRAGDEHSHPDRPCVRSDQSTACAAALVHKADSGVPEYRGGAGLIAPEECQHPQHAWIAAAAHAAMMASTEKFGKHRMLKPDAVQPFMQYLTFI